MRRSAWLLLTLLASASFAVAQPYVGTWELHRFQHEKRAVQEYPIHRITLSEDGIYLNSATPTGPIPVKYITEKDTENHGQSIFLIEDPETGNFEKVALLRVDKRELTIAYNRDGMILTYTRISAEADPSLLDSIPKKTINIQQTE